MDGVQRLGLSEDVGGATFMAAGSSAPELFTSLIGVLVAKGDVGTGTIVGSAGFNVLAIIGLCGILTKGPIYLNWWPLFRDATVYACAVLILAAVSFPSCIRLSLHLEASLVGDLGRARGVVGVGVDDGLLRPLHPPHEVQPGGQPVGGGEAGAARVLLPPEPERLWCDWPTLGA